jgi:hypothetical protein
VGEIGKEPMEANISMKASIDIVNNNPGIFVSQTGY